MQREQFLQIDREARSLYELLSEKKLSQAVDRYPAWLNSLESWHQRLTFGVKDFDRGLTSQFEQSQSRVGRLRTGLELILLVVFGLSILILWLSERALRPLHELAHWVRSVTARGLKREDKEALQAFPLMRAGEVNELAREFHDLATQLLEREKVVVAQRESLEEQNRQARDLGKLNETILASIRSPLLVMDLRGRITRANPAAIRLFSDAKESVLGRTIESVLPGIDLAGKIEPREWNGSVFGGHAYRLNNSDGLEGHVLMLEDLTDELSREKRLREAENLAAIGRLSAQVAHEVRNPLHSIGLEAELALDLVGKNDPHSLRSSIQAVLSGVDRLERITENYLKLSRRAPEERNLLDLRDIVESSLAQSEMSLKSSHTSVNWKTEGNLALPMKGDASLLEQIFGNLIRNSIQACEVLS
ncbi:PAS domain-containing protein, partial [bacterium]